MRGIKVNLKMAGAGVAVVCLSAAAFALLPAAISDGLTQLLGVAATFLANNVTLAVLLSSLVLWTTWRRDRLILSTNLNKQIQDYNLAIFKDHALAAQVAKQSFPNSDGAWVQGLYSVFYTLNMVRDGKQIRDRLYVQDTDLFKEDEFIWLTFNNYPEQMIYVLEGERGYHPTFKSYVRSVITLRYPDAMIEDVRDRYRARVDGKTGKPPPDRL